jgi:hypothetical protein
MTAPWVVCQSCHILGSPCPDGIEMDIPDEFEEIRIFFAQKGLISVLEEMA